MRNKLSIFRLFAVALVLLGFCVWSTGFAAEGPDKTKRNKGQGLYKTAGTPRYQILNINNLWTWTRSDGQSNHSPGADNGTYFPRGTKWCIYQDGFMFGAKAYVDAAKTIPAPLGQLIRVGGATYGVGTREGWVDGSGATAVPLSPADANARIYRVRRDWQVMSDDEVRRDAAESNEIGVSAATAAQMQRIRDQYAKDWAEWPVAHGAPYIERNGQPGYQAPPAFTNPSDLITGKYDEPGVAGADPNSPADQAIYTVYNDLDRNQSLGLYGSEPMGLEIQLTVWAYKRTDALGNIFFRRFRIINRGGVSIDSQNNKGAFTLDSMYCAQWSDPDLGSFADDLCGTDTTLSMGFIYNGNAIDSDYKEFNLPVPAAGFDFLAGPLIESAGSKAVFDFKYVDGYKNLPMTSFSYFSAGAPISDPPGNYTQGTRRWYRMLSGYAPVDVERQFYPFPPGVAPNRFPLSGDPVKRTGFIDGLGTTYSFAPGDRRINLSTGPFSLAPGDTQEIVVAFVAGLGSDRLSSVAVMKFNDRFAQNTFDALFQVPKPPAGPNVKAAELDGEVILEWGSDLARVSATETVVNQPGEYNFEGYNIYQFPSRNSSLSEATRVATFDLPEDPTVVLDEQFDVESGQVLFIPVQFGGNSGVTRYFKFNRDYILDFDKIYNGQEYYIGVTSYSVARQTGFLPAALESEPLIVTVQPQVPFGAIYQSAYGDTLPVSHSSGVSDGIVRPIVIDPKASTGQNYEVRFDTTGGATTWKLLNTSTNKTVVSGQTNQTGDTNYDIQEGGIFLVVSGPPPGMKEFGLNGTTRRISFAGAEGLGLEGFSGAIGLAYGTWFSSSTVTPDKLKNVVLKHAATDVNGNLLDPNDPDASFAYRYLRQAAAPPRQPSFAPFIVNPGPGYAYQDYKKVMPWAAYDTEANPPRRLMMGFHENNIATGLVDGKWWPPETASGIANNTSATSPREFFFVFDVPYSETPDPSLQVDFLNNTLPVMWWGGPTRRGANVSFVGDEEFVIFANHINLVSDVFKYTAPAATAGAAQEQASAEKIGVYPNPYYAFNPAETNRLFRFVTFNNLPRKASVRIFNLAGQLVRRIEKDDDSQFLQWDLVNHDNIPVASGMYIAYIDATLPSGGSAKKVLKMAIIQEQEVLDIY